MSLCGWRPFIFWWFWGCEPGRKLTVGLKAGGWAALCEVELGREKPSAAFRRRKESVTSGDQRVAVFLGLRCSLGGLQGAASRSGCDMKSYGA